MRSPIHKTQPANTTWGFFIREMHLDFPCMPLPFFSLYKIKLSFFISCLYLFPFFFWTFLLLFVGLFCCLFSLVVSIIRITAILLILSLYFGSRFRSFSFPSFSVCLRESLMPLSHPHLFQNTIQKVKQYIKTSFSNMRFFSFFSYNYLKSQMKKKTKTWKVW